MTEADWLFLSGMTYGEQMRPRSSGDAARARPVAGGDATRIAAYVATVALVPEVFLSCRRGSYTSRYTLKCDNQ